MLALSVVFPTGCSTNTTSNDMSSNIGTISRLEDQLSEKIDTNTGTDVLNGELPLIHPGETVAEKSVYTDGNGNTAIIGPDESEFVWVPITETSFARNDFGSYGFYDETDSEEYQRMRASSDDIWVHVPRRI